MATYHVCDRCGKNLGRNGGKLFGELYASRGFAGILDTVFGTQQFRIDVELCEDCAQKLVKWLKIDDNY